jgi:hypothetical protein
MGSIACIPANSSRSRLCALRRRCLISALPAALAIVMPIVRRLPAAYRIEFSDERLAQGRQSCILILWTRHPAEPLT